MGTGKKTSDAAISAENKHTDSIAHGLMEDINEHSVTADEGKHGFFYVCDLLECLSMCHKSFKKVSEEIEEYPRDNGKIVRGKEIRRWKAEGDTHIGKKEAFGKSQKL